MPEGVLEVFVIEGRNLKDQDMVGQNDAYVEIYTDKKYKHRTKTIENTNNPVWNEQFSFNLRKGDDTIHFKIYDADVVGKDDIGECKVKLKHVFDDGKFDEWVKLPAMLGLSSKGEIHVRMNFRVSHSCSRTDP
jgi:Ca2+-dependent lipid-binding protein